MLCNRWAACSVELLSCLVVKKWELQEALIEVHWGRNQAALCSVNVRFMSEEEAAGRTINHTTEFLLKIPNRNKSSSYSAVFAYFPLLDRKDVISELNLHCCLTS